MGIARNRAAELARAAAHARRPRTYGRAGYCGMPNAAAPARQKLAPSHCQ
jgi:hypothetical protein